MKKIAILGSTGSIGTQTLEVARENGDLQITALAAGNNIELLEKQIREFHPGLVAVWKEEKAKELKDRVKDLGCEGGLWHGWTSGGGDRTVFRDPGDGDRRYDRHSSDYRSYESWKGYCTCQ